MDVQSGSVADSGKPELPENGSRYASVGEDGRFYNNAAQKEGVIVAESSLPDSSTGYKGMTQMGFGSKSFRLGGESDCRVRFIGPDIYGVGQNTVNKKAYDQYEDVKRVSKKQEIHDLSCPTCNFYFTKRVILPRKAISPDHEVMVSLPTGQIPTPASQNDSSSEQDTTCLSYFRSSIPTAGKGVLFWESITETDISHQSGEVSVTMPEVIQPVTPVTGPLPDNQLPLLGHQREYPRPGVNRVEVIKAIVYGGLLESITSLCIIVSAAGGDAATLNIVALGLANVFGGLLILGNSLMTVKAQSAQQYEDQLGQPRHFLIHAIIAVISYFVFGLISPLVYGISFYKSDNKYLKLAALAAASLICITVLATGKAYVQRPPKAYLQTMFYYISLAVTVSVPAYIAGDLISILLKKFCVFESGESLSMPVLDTRALL